MEKIYLVRKHWPTLGAKLAGVRFTEKQLDAAEKHKDGFIGTTPDGRQCYLIKFAEGKNARTEK